MDSYRGWTKVDVTEGGGKDPNKMEVHNFHPYRDNVYGYVAAVAQSIRIEAGGEGGYFGEFWSETLCGASLVTESASGTSRH